MITDSQAAKMVMITYRPGYLVIESIIFGLGWLVFAVSQLAEQDYPRWQIGGMSAAGVALGAVFALLAKADMRRCRDAHIAKAAQDLEAVRQTTPVWWKRWPIMLQGLLALAAYLIISSFSRLDLPWLYVFLAAFPMRILALPEHKDIFEAAKERLIEMYSGRSDTEAGR